MRIIVTGGRHYSDFSLVEKILAALKPEFVIQGGATGADALAKRWANENNVPFKTYDADWDRYGNSAGPIRNAQMCQENQDAWVVAFPGKKGTRNCVSCAKVLGMTVLRVENELL